MELEEDGYNRVQKEQRSATTYLLLRRMREKKSDLLALTKIMLLFT